MSESVVGFIGTGVMGGAMARHVLESGRRLNVHNRTASRAEPLVAAGAAYHEDPASLARASEVVITMVGTPRDVESLYKGPLGLIENAAPGSLLIDMTTSDPELAVELGALAETRGVQVLDAPVSGGDIGARSATLSIMVGGRAAAFERALPILKLMGKTIVRQGEWGAGQYTKLCNQIAIASTMLSVCEAMAFAKAAGLEPLRVLESITTGAAGSWALSQLMPRALRGDYEPGFAVAHFTKDLAIALACADRLGLALPGLELARRLYDELGAGPDRDRGTQVLLRRYLEQPR